jgi:VWFA-related protein
MRRTSISLVLLLLAAATPATPKPKPTTWQSDAKVSSSRLSPAMRVSTRLVLVDVAVTDKAGKHVKDLAASEFTILEDGKPQRLAVFSVEGPQNTPAPASAAHSLPPNICTNRPEYGMPVGALTILLLDTLNTRAEDQAYVRTKMLHFVETQLAAHDRIAVFSLGQSLRELQDFTDNPELLQAAIKEFLPQKPGQLDIEAVEKRLPRPHESGGTSARTAQRIASMLAQLREFYAEQANLALDERVHKTLAGFRILARAVGGHPGRKNLIWVSAAFPLTSTHKVVQYKADLSDPNRTEAVSEIDLERSYLADFRRTVALLADAQVAVYPVDARGLVGSMVSDTSDSGTNEMSQFKTGSEFGDEISKQSGALIDSQATMTQFAGETGGRVYKNRNDIDHAVGLSIEDGAAYYSLAYYPQDKNWNGKFRKIQVKVDRPGLELRYRQGYYAAPLEAKEQVSEQTADIVSALDLSSPDATLVVFDAKVSPPARNGKQEVTVDFLVDMSTLSAPQDKDGKRAYDVEFHAAAFAPDGKLAGHKDIKLKAAMKPEEYAALRQQGLPFHTQLELPPGRYQIRLAVRDDRTGFLGTTGMPLLLNSE